MHSCHHPSASRRQKIESRGSLATTSRTSAALGLALLTAAIAASMPVGAPMACPSDLGHSCRIMAVKMRESLVNSSSVMAIEEEL